MKNWLFVNEKQKYVTFFFFVLAVAEKLLLIVFSVLFHFFPFQNQTKAAMTSFIIH